MKIKKILSFIIALCMSFAITGNVVFAQVKFTDVPDNAWYKDYVYKLSEKGIINGYPDGKFGAGDSLSAAQLIVMVVRALGFNDLIGEERWYQGYIDKARELGLIKDGEFVDWNDFERNITRQEIARIIVRALNEDYPADIQSYTPLISDYSSISSDFNGYVLKAYVKGIVNGAPDGRFNADMSATRAEASKMVANLIYPDMRKAPDLSAIPDSGTISSATSQPIVIYDSSYKVNMTFDSDVLSVLVYFKIGDRDKSLVYDIADNVFDRTIYLPYGPGSYNITIYTSDKNSDSSTTYHYNNEFVIENRDTRDMEYLLPTDKVESDSEEIIQLASDIIKDSATDMEKAKAIHDWVASNIAYDTEAYFSDNIKNYSALETLKAKKAVCSGYANLTAALFRAIGIRTKIVSGISIWADRGETWENTTKTDANHAWNEVFVDGKWIIVDTTWDAGYVDIDAKTFTFELSDKYFNPTAEVFAKDHRKLEEYE